MKLAFIILASLAVLLGFITYFALFSGPQIVQPNQPAQNYAPVAPTSTQATASSSATSSAFVNGSGNNDGSNGTSNQGNGGANQTVYQTMFSAPYPVTWTEGQPQLSIIGATMQDHQLVLSVNVQMGPAAQCVPVNLRLIADEQGDMQAPTAPATPNFPLAPDGTCQGDAETAYNESVTFTVDPANLPFLFSTGDSANAFFEISTTTSNGLKVDVPQKNG